MEVYRQNVRWQDRKCFCLIALQRSSEVISYCHSVLLLLLLLRLAGALLPNVLNSRHIDLQRARVGAFAAAR